MNFHESPLLNPQDLFARHNVWQAWLDVEAAMAQAQAEIGMIPQWAADEIAAKAHMANLDSESLERSVRQTMAPIVSLVRALAGICGSAGDFVHWGGTTQNIMYTGRQLLVRRGHHALLSSIANTLDLLSGLAETHAGTIMAGRTNNRHALPITFGFKIAGWIEELSRQNDRFREVEPRVFSLFFGGAVGAMHSFEGKGQQLSEVLARRLSLTNVLAPGRASLDTFAEYIAVLGLFAACAGRIGSELYRLMTDEVEEVAESLDETVIGSSTMPHKVNPKHVVNVIATATLLRAKVAPALEAALPGHEGDAACNQIMSNLIEEACTLALELAQRLERALGSLSVDGPRMAANLDRSHDFIASERLMMLLAEKIGRTQAHDLVHHAIAAAVADGASILDKLKLMPEITAHMSPSAIGMALDPAGYLGESERIARQAATLGILTAQDLRRRAG